MCSDTTTMVMIWKRKKNPREISCGAKSLNTMQQMSTSCSLNGASTALPPSWSLCPGAEIGSQWTEAPGYQKSLFLHSREKIEILSSCSQNEHCQFCWLLPAYTSASGALCRWRRCQKKDAQRNFCAGVPNKSIHTFSIFSKVIPSSSFQVTPWPLKARPRCHHLALHWQRRDSAAGFEPLAPPGRLQ